MDGARKMLTKGAVVGYTVVPKWKAQEIVATKESEEIRLGWCMGAHFSWTLEGLQLLKCTSEEVARAGRERQ